MSKDASRHEFIDSEIDLNVARGINHLHGAEADLISKNADLIMHAVHQHMLSDKSTFEQAAVHFVLKAVKYQMTREMFTVGEITKTEGDPYQRDAA